MNDQQKALASELDNRDKKRQAAMDEQKRDADGKFGSGGGTHGKAPAQSYNEKASEKAEAKKHQDHENKMWSAVGKHVAEERKKYE